MKSRVAVTASSWARMIRADAFGAAWIRASRVDGLRGREGDVEARAVFVLAVPQAAEACLRAGDAAGEDLFESAGFDGAVEAEGGDTSTMPAACLAMFLVVLCVVAVGLEVVDRRGGFTQTGDGGDQYSPPP